MCCERGFIEGIRVFLPLLMKSGKLLSLNRAQVLRNRGDYDGEYKEATFNEEQRAALNLALKKFVRITTK